ncbi:AraC family transcriptional regulator [Polaribacter sp. KT 15]|uniref:helix-turn-helix domain-containing protein n=1 Tax=Polaribacter sp. KT 15 TaxID=1896175 RepID=UPI00155F7E19|nr:helix-turn-helix domain-containing protein [Polaribacter sp. KT 15]
MKIVLHITSFLLFLGNFNTIAQNSKKFENYTFDELSDKYYEYKFTDSIKAKKFANFYFNKAVKEKDTVKAIDGKYYLSEVYKNDSIYINYLDSLISKTKVNPNKMYPTYAYLEKGLFYFHKENKNLSLENWISALKEVEIHGNDSLEFIIKKNIAALNYDNKKFIRTKKLYLECLRYYEKNKLKIEPSNYFSLLINTSKVYLNLENIDSAKIFNEKANKYAKKTNENIFIGYCFYGRGTINFREQNYEGTIENLKKSIPYIVEDENYRILFKVYNLIAKSHTKLNNKNEALKYYFLIDSIYNKTKIPSNKVKNSYNYLSNHYKNKQDLKNQLKYINKYLKVDSILNIRSKNLSKTFTEEYDRPKLIAEKQKIISELNNEVSFYKKSRIYIAIVLILSFILFLYQFRKRKKQEQKFDNLTIKLKNKKVVENSVNSNTNTQKTLPENIITELLAKLDSFQQQPENFTNNKLTLSILAKELETNSNYLSKVINQKKGCNFSTYLRKLRIDYALDLLEKDTTIRKFSIDAIAKEVGFKNAETFSKAFFKETELNPSFYIKQLKKKK